MSTEEVYRPGVHVFYLPVSSRVFRSCSSPTSELADRNAVYIRSDLNYSEIWHDVEITVTVLSHPFPNTHVVGIYQSKTGRISQLIDALTHLHKSVLTKPTIAITLFGELNINNCTTDHRKQIDHI